MKQRNNVFVRLDQLRAQTEPVHSEPTESETTPIQTQRSVGKSTSELTDTSRTDDLRSVEAKGKPAVEEKPPQREPECSARSPESKPLGRTNVDPQGKREDEGVAKSLGSETESCFDKPKGHQPSQTGESNSVIGSLIQLRGYLDSKSRFSNATWSSKSHDS